MKHLNVLIKKLKMQKQRRRYQMLIRRKVMRQWWRLMLSWKLRSKML